MTDFISCKVNDLKDHPDALKLKVATVSDGKSSYSVVCGAKNIRLGMITILAKPGATTAKGVLIQKSSIRGVESDGMLCSPLELGISQEQGIVDLPPETTLGQSYTSLSKTILSSTPWWSYKLVEQFYWDEKNQKIQVIRDNFDKSSHLGRLLSETYWDNNTYVQRNLFS